MENNNVDLHVYIAIVFNKLLNMTRFDILVKY